MGAHRLPRGGVLDAAGKDRAREGAFCLPSCAVIQGLCGTKLASLANCVRCAATFMPITLHAALCTGVRSGRPCGGGVQPAAALVCVLFSAHPACCSCRVVGAGPGFRVVPERSELCCARAPGKRQHTLPYGAVCDVGLRRSAHIRCLQALCGPAALEQKLSGCALTLRAP